MAAPPAASARRELERNVAHGRRRAVHHHLQAWMLASFCRRLVYFVWIITNEIYRVASE